MADKKEAEQNGLRGGIPQKKFILSEFPAFLSGCF
jgi:hypothetical protein